MPDGLPAAPAEIPVLYRHYWRPGHTQRPCADDGDKSACLDWSVVKGGKLVAYRWDGEPTLVTDHLEAAQP